MAGTYDILTILKRELAARGIPAACIASLSGISHGKLSAYLNEVIPCPGQDSEKLIAVWEQIKKLLEHTTMIPLSFRDAGKVRRLITAIEDGSVQILVVRSDK